MPIRLANLITVLERVRGAAVLAALCLILALLAASPRSAHAADVQAKVTGVAADGSFLLALPGGHGVRAGDMVTVSTEVPGVGRVNLQTRWRVIYVRDNIATAIPAGPLSGRPKPGFDAVVVTSGQPGVAGAAAGKGDILDYNRKKAEGGDVEAMLRLGYHYLGTIRLTAAPAKPDPQQAQRWFAMAAQHNNAEAACALADIYRGRNDTAQAVRFTRQAAEGGNSACQYALGMALLNGDGVAKNPSEAAVWISKAAQANVLPARYQYAMLYLHGIGVKQDLPRALQMFHHLASHDNVPGAMFYVSVMLARTQPQQALAWALKAANAGHAMAMYQLGTLYLSGDATAKVAKNLTEARRWYAMAAAAGEPESMMMLADLMEHGVGGPRDSRAAARWAMKALRGRVVQVQGLLLRPQTWSTAFWKALQMQLQQAGVYKGRADGRFGKATVQAIEAVIKHGA